MVNKKPVPQIQMGTLKHQFLKLRVSFRLVSLLKSMTCPSPSFSNILTGKTKKYVARFFWQ